MALKLTNIPSYLAQVLILIYQYAISPWLMHRCRYIPTCSQYAYEAFSHFGFFTALLLALRRLFRCHPFGKSGFDPLPLNSVHSSLTRRHCAHDYSPYD